MEYLLGLFLKHWLPLTVTLLFVFVGLNLSKRVLFNSKKFPSNEHLFPRQLLMLALILAAVIAIVVSLPLPSETQSEILKLIGLLLSGILAFASTSVFTNLAAGAMMRFTQPFRTGDFVRIDQYFGRITERGLFDCEIQTETRELISLPNAWLIGRPISTARSSGTIVSVNLSLGYDLHHSTIEDLLKKAALDSGLEDPFVHIQELGDYSVTYKVNGLLKDVKNLLTARSKLYTSVLDFLHNNNVEIVSPAFMNQRRLADNQRILPQSAQSKQEPKRARKQTVAEDIVFDKAENAAQTEKRKQELIAQREELEQQLEEADKALKPALQEHINMLAEQITLLGQTPPEKE